MNLVQILWTPTSRFLWTIFSQTVVMGFAWGFTGEILPTDVLPLLDHIVHLIVGYPTVLTLMVTSISTILSIVTSLFFTYAVKKALRHHLSGPITLFKLRTAIALSTSTWIWPRRRKSLTLPALAFVAYAVFTLLNSRSAPFSMNSVEIYLTLVCTVGSLYSYPPLFQ
ncbi:hypothetical protein BDR04DRAFT_572422 [Suillus decipiens]|nr:hypothetical protein BDR04DRAFT_572422 [Suillus decipiens]